MQASQQYSARRLDPVLLLDLIADSETPAPGRVLSARLSELDPRLLVSVGFFTEINGMREESGSISGLWGDDMITGSVYPIINVGHSAKYGTAIPGLDHEILRPIINDDDTITEVFAASLSPAVDALELVARYVPHPGTGYASGDRVRLYVFAEVGMSNNAPADDILAVLNRVKLNARAKLTGSLATAGDEN